MSDDDVTMPYGVALSLVDKALAKLAHHYGITEDQFLKDFGGGLELVDRADLLRIAIESLTTALWTLNCYGFDDAAVTAMEDAGDVRFMRPDRDQPEGDAA